jgi:hypothetical protein
MKAMVCLLSLEFWILLSVYNYFRYLFSFPNQLFLFSMANLVPLALLMGLNWAFFWKDDKWKEYVETFDKLPKEQNTKGRYIVISLTIFLFLNFCFSTYINPPLGGWK